VDALGERGKLLSNLEYLLEYNRDNANQPENQDSLFAGMEDTSSLPHLQLRPAEPAKSEDTLVWEKELLGLYVSGHPLEKYRERIEKSGSDITKLRASSIEDQTVIIVGIIEECKEIFTKGGGKKMAFMRIADLNGTIEAVVFPKVFDKVKDNCIVDSCVVIKGKLSKRNSEISILIDKIKPLDTESLKQEGAVAQ